MNHYELLYLVAATYNEEELQPIKDNVQKLIAKYNGRIILEDSLGKRKLAYPVKKFRFGYYLIFEFDMESAQVNKLETELRLTPEILRHMIVKKQFRVAKNRVGTGAPAAAGVTPVAPATTAEVMEKIINEPQSAPEPKGVQKEEKKVDLDELDKKLDEILDGDIL